jgi:DNA-binding response OmpR family regulator
MTKKILIIEDESEFLELLRTRLEADGYEVLSAPDGRKGLEAAQREKPDLILLDVVLPDANGLKVCRAIKTDNATQQIKVIVCTNKLDVIDAQEARESCADEFVEKLSDHTILLKAIRSLI